ncbi:MAG TPA: hypothetical protein VGZ29_09400 [Terriglobia bacterium]|nr:hypothetical protein [Terriglobia bacterium]
MAFAHQRHADSDDAHALPAHLIHALHDLAHIAESAGLAVPGIHGPPLGFMRITATRQPLVWEAAQRGQAVDRRAARQDRVPMLRFVEAVLPAGRYCG